ncbi:MAG: hypothetical protein H6Q42_308, partial [Deltaproteobacteria bacterium]|nr:hypothetical protein [Deltaproteobacteria bacterium]
LKESEVQMNRETISKTPEIIVLKPAL